MAPRSRETTSSRRATQDPEVNEPSQSRQGTYPQSRQEARPETDRVEGGGLFHSFYPEYTSQPPLGEPLSAPFDIQHNAYLPPADLSFPSYTPLPPNTGFRIVPPIGNSDIHALIVRTGSKIMLVSYSFLFLYLFSANFSQSQVCGLDQATQGVTEVQSHDYERLLTEMAQQAALHVLSKSLSAALSDDPTNSSDPSENQHPDLSQ